ncbi:D-alanyl-D-alanine carboxypeptidase family protein [Bengtsoniella intestinalis]|uniref:D-alanyl-D-alanine carboxypeptidase family protein n=1 Tax=Bengtsoniella intestinalis TaxID=3073143 RepID=UPI00391F074B
MKRIVCALLCVACCMGVCHGVEVVAPSAILMEKETGTILYAKDEHTPREPASVTKVMTLLLVMEAIDAGQLAYDDLLTASDYASSMGGSQIWLETGEVMSVSDMLKAVCVVSANDCAVALAEAVAGSESAFVEKMNLRAQELGMADTLFQNATGLPADDHYTSAYDIAIMSRELILNHPDLRQYTTIWMDTLRDGTSELSNTNRLIYTYEGATGLKTGSTSTALYCLSATAERDGMELIAVVMQSPTSAQRLSDVTALLNEGFANYALEQIVPEQAIAPVAVTLGKQDTVQGVLEGETALLLEKAQTSNLLQEITLVEGVEAPIAQGDILGTLTVTADGEVVAEFPIVAGETVGRLTWWDMVVNVGRMAVLGK